MLIEYIEPSLFQTRDYIDGVKEWIKESSRYRSFSFESLTQYFITNGCSGLALYDDNLHLVGICIYAFIVPFGTTEKHMYISHFALSATVRKTFMAGKFIKRIEQLAKVHKCAYILYSSIPTVEYFKNHPNRYKPVEIVYRQEL